MDELVNAIVKSYGIIGLFMVAPIVAVVYLWRDNIRLNKALSELAQKHTDTVDALGQRVVAAQEKRVEDSKGLTGQLMAMVGEHAASSKEQTLALDRVGDMVSMLNAQINTIAGERIEAPPPPPTRPPRRGTG